MMEKLVLYEDIESLSDETLIELYRDNNLVAIEILILRYKTYVRSILKTSYFVGSEKDDFIQEGMIGLFKAICDYNPSRKATFQTFANICIKRQISTAFKTMSRKKHLPLNTSVSLNQALSYEDEGEFTLIDTLTEEDTPEDFVINNERYLALKEVMKQLLSDFEWTVISLYIDGKDYQQIAHILQKTPKSIDNALQRIKRKLSKELNK